MVCRKEEWSHLNYKITQHAPCTIGILVDRPLSACTLVSCIISTKASARNNTKTIDLDKITPTTATEAQLPLNKVVAIFFEGLDDREAASFMVPLATHPLVEATLVRFLLERDNDGHSKIGMPSRFTSQVAMNAEEDSEAKDDEEFISNFQKSYVETGIVMFVERYASSGFEVVTALSSMAGLYSLFIVGKEGPHLTPMMRGIRDWEECPELGPIGDLLASKDFMDSGSVLILQQQSVTKRGLLLSGEDN